MSLWAIVPVKPFFEGKSRLSEILSGQERVVLNQFLLKRTLQTLARVESIDMISVVSRDPTALEIADCQQAFQIHESGKSLNLALSQATKSAMENGANSILVIPSDLPLLTVEEVNQLINKRGNPPEVIIAPDRWRKGTNALLINPADLINFAFGQDSYHLHLEYAKQVGARIDPCFLPAFELDLDLPEDFDLLKYEESFYEDFRVFQTQK